MEISSNGSSVDVEIDAHAVEPAIVLRFNAANSGEEKQRRIVQLDGLNEHSDSAAIARLVADQCKPLVSTERLAELEQLIAYLQKRHSSTSSNKGSSRSSGSTPTETRAKLENLEDYMELLYEEGESKQRGVALLSDLAVNTDAANLSKIVDNEQLMGALTRVWREDTRKNFELAIQMGQLFHRLSQFAPFHAVLSHWKIGLLSLQLAEYELRRWELWRDQMKEMDEQAKRKWTFAMRKQDQLIAACLRILLNLAEDLRIENKMQKKGLLPLLFKSLDHSSPQLLSASVKFLWKLSMFAENQDYIANTAGTIEQLVSLFSPTRNGSDQSPLLDSELFWALCSLLFNCSFEPTSRRRMVNAGLVSLISPHMATWDVALALMYQLSIEDDAKAMVAFTDCIPQLLDMLLHNETRRGDPPGECEKREMLVKSLLVNIVLEKRNAQLLCGSDGQGLDALMAFALDGECGDLLAMKVVRNIASHEGPTHEMFLKWVPQLVENATAKVMGSCGEAKGRRLTNHVFGLECLGVCVHLSNAPWPELDASHGVVPFLGRLLQHAEQLPTPGIENGGGAARREQRNGGAAISDDVLLQAVQLTGTLAAYSPEMAERVERQLLPHLMVTLNKRQEDDEIVLQCVFAFLCLLSHGGPLAKRMCGGGGEEGVPSPNNSVAELLLNLMHDKNAQLRQLCERALQLIAEVSKYWRGRIQEAHFRWHNSQWLEMVQTPDGANDRLIFLANDVAEQEESFGVGTALAGEELLRGTEF